MQNTEQNCCEGKICAKMLKACEKYLFECEATSLSAYKIIGGKVNYLRPGSPKKWRPAAVELKSTTKFGMTSRKAKVSQYFSSNHQAKMIFDFQSWISF